MQGPMSDCAHPETVLVCESLSQAVLDMHLFVGNFLTCGVQLNNALSTPFLHEYSSSLHVYQLLHINLPASRELAAV